MKNTFCFFLILLGGFLQSTWTLAEDAETEHAPVVEVAEVTTIQSQISRRYTGKIISCSVVRIVSCCSGQILEVGFKDGDPVKKGQTLYKLDPIQYKSVERNARAKVAETKARLQFADSSYNRYKNLYESKKAVSLEEVENAKVVLDSAKAALESAEAELTAASDNLAKTTIIAPDDGLAGINQYTPGNYVTPESGMLVTIIQTSPIRVGFSISYADYLSLFGSPELLKEKGEVSIRLSDGTPYSEKGRIELLNNEINSNTDSILVYALFENKDSKLIAGGIVQVTLTRLSDARSIIVPATAIVYDNAGSYVFVVDKNNRVEQRYVKTGYITEARQIIEEGLREGELVVVKGTHKLTPGSLASPKK